MLNITDIKANLKIYCPPSYDGLLCWSQTLAGYTAKLPCPPQFVLGYKNPHDNVYATKKCNTNSEWFSNNDGITWSNYSLCAPPPGHYVTAIADVEIPLSDYGQICSSTLLNVRKYLLNSNKKQNKRK